MYNDEPTNYIIYNDGRVYSIISKKFLKGTTKRNEYKSVQLTVKNKLKSFMVHRLVAETFLPNPYNLPIVHHKNRNKLDNRVENLQWVTYQENCEKVTSKKDNKNKVPMPELGEDWKEFPTNHNYIVGRNGQIYSKLNKIFLSPTSRNGYERVNINKKTYSVHIMVYETFKGPVHGIIDHIDGNRQNNALSNLRDTTQSENMANAQRNGHSGQKRVRQYDKSHNFIAEYASCSEAARKYNVTFAAISSAAKRGGTSCGYYWEII